MSFDWSYMMGRREVTRGVVTVREYERGLLYRRGSFVRVLEAGQYRIWPFSRERVLLVDVRRASEQITNQKLLTADAITVALNITAAYEFADVAAAIHTVAEFGSQLHEDVQIAARGIVGALTVDELMEQRVATNTALLEAVRPLAAGYGINVVTIAIKDIMLAPRVRDMLMKEVEARRTAQAMLLGAREELAALRALANAAKLAAEHPQLLRLRELDTVRAFASTPGNTVVMGVDRTIPITARNAAVSSPEPTENNQ